MNNENKNTDQAQDKTILAELLKQKSHEGHDMISYYVKAFTVYVAITGALMKFAFDENATSELRQALFMVELLISIFGLFACLLGEKLRRSLGHEINNLNQKLGSPLVSTEMKHLKYSVIGSVVFVVFVILGWIYLFVQ